MNKILCILLLLCLSEADAQNYRRAGRKAPVSGGGTPFSVTDNFNRTNESPLSGGGNWTNRGSNLKVVSNGVGVASANTDSYAFYSGHTWSANQSSEATIVASNANVYNAVGVRMAASGAFGYILVENNGTLQLYYVNSSESWASVHNYGSISGLGAGDVIKLSVSGTSLTAYINGTQEGTSYTDTNIASGSPGLQAYINDVNNPFLDDWTGAEL